MIRIDIKRWYSDTALYRLLCSFFKDRVWFGYWWASVCSQHGDGYNHNCDRCKTGAWTRTKHTLFSERGNCKWAIGKKVRIKHD